MVSEYGYPDLYANDSAFHRQQLAERMNRIIDQAAEVYEAAYKVAKQTHEADDILYYQEAEEKLDRLCKHTEEKVDDPHGDPWDYLTRCPNCGRVEHDTPITSLN